MLSRKKDILAYLENQMEPLPAKEIAEALALDRANVSRYLNELYKEEKIEKSKGRPVLYQLKPGQSIREETEDQGDAFDQLIGHSASLKVMIQQAKAAVLYPPRGLHTIIFGETGTGKTLFAECMYQFALEANALPAEAPFISFNCADYAQNPQLLFGHIFGVKKGSYTGATEDRSGLIHQADGGILFLDEIHRLPPEGQEMLFTFIDKGVYRPLGESSETHTAQVQIIGATTENSDVLLATFNRRIPMTITLPPLAERTIEERYELVATFLQQEAQRLNQKIVIERDGLLAYMLYPAEANIGQVQRDLKLVCAKAFLHYRTHKTEYLTITQQDLPLAVQKGLLLVKEAPERLDRLVDRHKSHFSFVPTSQKMAINQDVVSDMTVYNEIEERVDEALKMGALEEVDLEGFIQKNLTHYFSEYLEQLSLSDIHQELIPADIRNLTEKVYDFAEEHLNRTYESKSRFAFALHLQSTLERIKEQRPIVHPNLNAVRKKYSKEFQVAIDLSAIIEEQLAIDIPFDEIGFITMFLTLDIEEPTQVMTEQVGVMVLMHGKSTASSMLETVQGLLDTTVGTAIDMPLTMKVKDMYEIVRQTIAANRETYQYGILVLTDMGSLNAFGDMLAQELGLEVRTLSMASTPVVLEAVRMASVGRPLEDIYQSCQMAMGNASRPSLGTAAEKQPAVVVACFTGEGVAKKLEEQLKKVLNPNSTNIIPMQFLQLEDFIRRIDQLSEQHTIKAIVGTVPVHHRNIPYFSAYEAFDEKKVMEIKYQVEELSLEQMSQSLTGTLTHVGSVYELMATLQKVVQELEKQLDIQLLSGVKTGMILHLAFLMESLKSSKALRQFSKADQYLRQHAAAAETVKAVLKHLEEQYQVTISQDERAYLVQMLIENQLTRS
ncbi:sigma 54-interacting transcriptional regulator [Carnobacterium mobile]|uniref:sigma 54-interacting transcriptional regulator n=1 Tax=Carnobacterium mobile TaxID=2750 RepID=UPI001867AF1F|nr:sigma-54-dependent transcriptional regulator [Carnobacterium mobile]